MSEKLSQSNRTRRRLTFSIASLMLLTVVVAVHCAFPVLIDALLNAMGCSVVLFVIVFAPVFFIAAFASKSENGQLAVHTNPFIRVWCWVFVGAVSTLYFLMASFGLISVLIEP